MAVIKRGTQLKVGIFLLAVLALFGIGLFTVGSHKKYFQRQYTLWVRFSDVGGLIIGAPVRLAGVTVGRVSAIRFPPVIDQKKVIVELKINAGVKERIREDSSAMVRTMGLLGDKYVEITMGSPGARILQDGEELKGVEAIDLYQYVAKTEKAIDSINTILEDVKAISQQIRKGKGFIHSLLYNPEGEQLISNLNESASSLRELIDNLNEASSSLSELISGFEDLVRDLKSTSSSLRRLVEGKGTRFMDELTENLARTSSSLDELIAELTETSRSMKRIVQKIERGEGSLGALINDPTVYEDLKTVLGGVKRSKAIQRLIRYSIKKQREGEAAGEGKE